MAVTAGAGGGLQVEQTSGKLLCHDLACAPCGGPQEDNCDDIAIIAQLTPWLMDRWWRRYDTCNQWHEEDIYPVDAISTNHPIAVVPDPCTVVEHCNSATKIINTVQCQGQPVSQGCGSVPPPTGIAGGTAARAVAQVFTSDVIIPDPADPTGTRTLQTLTFYASFSVYRVIQSVSNPNGCQFTSQHIDACKRCCFDVPCFCPCDTWKDWNALRKGCDYADFAHSTYHPGWTCNGHASCNNCPPAACDAAWYVPIGTIDVWINAPQYNQGFPVTHAKLQAYNHPFRAFAIATLNGESSTIQTPQYQDIAAQSSHPPGTETYGRDGGGDSIVASNKFYPAAASSASRNVTKWDRRSVTTDTMPDCGGGCMQTTDGGSGINGACPPEYPNNVSGGPGSCNPPAEGWAYCCTDHEQEISIGGSSGQTVLWAGQGSPLSVTLD